MTGKLPVADQWQLLQLPPAQPEQPEPEPDSPPPLPRRATAEGCFCSFLEPHLGQTGCALPITSSSNSWPHLQQQKSKIGIS